MPQRHEDDPADSDLFKRQEAVLSLWAEKLRKKQRLSLETEHIFDGTPLALGGPNRCRDPPPVASPAHEHLQWRVGIIHHAPVAHSLAAPLRARPPAA